MRVIKKGTIPLLALILGVSLFSTSVFSDEKQSHNSLEKGDASSEHGQIMSPESQKIKDVLIAYSVAVSNRDIAKMGSFLTGESFSVVEGKHANWGWQDYRDNHLTPEFSSNKFKLLNYNLSNIRVSEGHMLSYAIFDFELLYELEGEKKSKKGMGTAVFDNEKGNWLIRHIHTS